MKALQQPANRRCVAVFRQVCWHNGNRTVIPCGVSSLHRAKNAIKAGLEGVKVHGANGQRIDQFLRNSANQRSDAYSDAQENRAGFLFEALTAWACNRRR